MVPSTVLKDYLEEIRRLVESAEEDPQTHTFAHLADLYQKIGQLDRALEVIENGLKQHPHYLNARLIHASVLRKLDRLPEARCTLEHVLQIDPENLVARTPLIEIGSDQASAQIDDASAEMSRPRTSDVNRWLNALDIDWSKISVEDGHNDAKTMSQDEEETHMARMEVVEPSPALVGSTSTVLDTATLAALYVEQGFFAEAIGVYERLIARSPYNPELAVKLEYARKCAEKSCGDQVALGRGGRGPIPVPEPVASAPSLAGPPLTSDHLKNESVKSGLGRFKGWMAWLKKDSN